MTVLRPRSRPRRAMRLRRAASLAASLLCFIGAVALLHKAGLPERTAFTGSISAGIVTAPEIGASAPPFEARLLNGGWIDLASLGGKVVILNFWATWCAPCEIEMPILQALHQQYPPTQLQVIGINTGEDRAAIEPWTVRLQLSLPIALDAGLEIGTAYQVRGQPQTFIIDKQGVIRAIFFGATDFDRLRAAIEPLL